MLGLIFAIAFVVTLIVFATFFSLRFVSRKLWPGGKAELELRYWIGNKLGLRVEDFDDITKSSLSQYGSPLRCPIAKALVRQGFQNVIVGSGRFSYVVENKRIYHYTEGEARNVEQCRIELLAGASEAYIQVEPTINIYNNRL